MQDLQKQKFKESGASCLSRDSVAQITGNHSSDRQDAGVAEEEAQLGAEVLAGGRHGGRQVRHSLLPVSVSQLGEQLEMTARDMLRH